MKIIDILEDLKQLAENDNIDSYEKDIIMVDRIKQAIEDITTL